ncbi:hypothetical protein DPMN_054878 [Dreissena polymorpha]|uniref:Uncharacterized protein n=1 Tax=Dreissena polymorpha TaxID=45954 RepID=A0A9D4CRH2_DREPO|nr:hypothetical protein DPMN_054878 [Dreissena polymorpha]
MKPILLHGVETWRTTVTYVKKIQVYTFSMNILKIIKTRSIINEDVRRRAK